MQDNLDLCVCAHIRKYHRNDNANDAYCDECWDMLDFHDAVNPYIEFYHSFKFDNLRFLEHADIRRNRTDPQ